MTGDRVVYLPAGAEQFLDPGIPIKPSPEYCRFAQEKDGTVWIAAVGKSVFTLRKVGDKAEGLTEVKIDPLAMLIDRRGSLWIASGVDGLRRVPAVARVRGRRIEGFGPEAGLDGLALQQRLAEDRMAP